MFRRLANLVRGFLSLFIGGIERQNPEALLEVEKENIRKQIANYNQGLAAHAGLCERLMTQVKAGAGRARAARENGREPARRQRELASQQALRLQTVQRELVENRTQLVIGRGDVQGAAARARCVGEGRAGQAAVAEEQHR
jgi:phage shock protein A